MATSAPKLPQQCPTKPETGAELNHQGRTWKLLLEPEGWRLRSRAERFPADFRTGTFKLDEAKRRAKGYLDRLEADPIKSRKGGGTLEALAAIYLDAPKKTKRTVAANNTSRLRVICRTSLKKELKEVTCREVGPEFWQAYQIAQLAKLGLPFDLTARRREHIQINAAVRAARCLFLPALTQYYRRQGLDVRSDASEAVMLRQPYLPPSKVAGEDLVTAWKELAPTDRRMWLAVGLARFAGLRREEISACRGGWIEERKGGVYVALRDRPEEQWWTKTGKPYVAQVIDPELAAWLLECMTKPEALIVPDPPDGSGRDPWFERVPQRWLRAHGTTGTKPLHRMRGLYADHIAAITEDAVAARTAGVKEAQKNLGHASSHTTENSYMTPDALR